MAFETLTSRQKVLPASAVGATVTLQASWGAAAWVEITASTVAAWLLHGLVIGATTGISATYDIEFDVGVGAAGLESVVTQFKCRQQGVGSGGAGLPSALMLAVALDNIGAGVRVAVRGRKDTTTNRAFAVKVAYSEKPATHTMTTSTKAQIPIPSAANSVSVTPNASAWNNSAWVELTPSTAAALLITAVIWGHGTSNIDAAIDLGLGSAGNEVVIDTVKIGAMDTEGCPQRVNLLPPLDAVPASSRLSIRMRKTGTDVTAWRFAVESIEKPL